MLVRHIRKTLDVKNVERRVCDSLAKNKLGIGSERRLKLLVGAIRRDEGNLDAHSLKSNCKKVVSSAVNRCAGNDVIARRRDIEGSEEVSRHARRSKHSRSSALHLADLSCYGVASGILKTRIEVSLRLKVEKLTHSLAGGIFKGGALNYRHLSGLTVTCGVTALNTLCSNFSVNHGICLFS